MDGGAQVFAHEVTAEAEFEALLYLFDIGKGTGEVMRLLFSGQKYVEIAVRMEIPIGTVKT